MEELYEFLVKLGPGWMSFIIIGTIGGAIAYLVSHRQYLKMMRAGHEEQIKLKDETLAMYKAAKDDIEKERNVYRDKLHEEKAHHQSTLLRLTELEARPDLSKILALEQQFHEQKMAINQKMLDALEKMDNKMEKQFSEHSMMCGKTLEMMKGLVDYLVKAKILPPDYQL